MIGDSFTFGHGVRQGEDIGGQLRRSNRTVLNLGMSANGPLLELASLKEYGEQIRAKNVIWMYFEGNDLRNLDQEQTSELLLKYLNPDFSQGLLRRQTDVDRVLRKYSNSKTEQQRLALSQSHLLMISRIRKMTRLVYLRERFGQLKYLSYPDPPLELLRDILGQAKRRVSSWGGRLYFVYLPDGMRYADPPCPADTHHRKAVLALVRQLSLPVIDIHKTMSRHADPLSLYPLRQPFYDTADGRRPLHYNSDGYRLIAKEIEKHLAQDE